MSFRTTHPDVAYKNLDFTIARAERVLVGNSGSVPAAQVLIDHLLLRVRFTSNFNDLDTAERVSAALLAAVPDSTDARRLRVAVLTATHRYAEACALFASPADVASGEDQLITLAIATGDADQILEQAQARVEKSPDYARFNQLAAAQLALGMTEAADASFAQALDHYTDVSPFAVAWVQYQRANLWREQPEKSRAFYLQALSHLPSYVGAIVGLAELEAQNDALDDAIARLLPIARDPDVDPDLPAVLAAMLMRAGSADEAAQFAAQATEGFDRWLVQHELAVAAHAIEFFEGVGNQPGRAQALRVKLTEQAQAQYCTESTTQ